MPLRQLCCFTILATIVAFAAAGSLDPYTRQFDVAQPGRLHRANAFRTKSETPAAVFVPVQSPSKDPRDLAAGKLLVASRRLADPNFAKTVILLVQYGDQGVVGLTLNRRTHVALSRVLADIQGSKDRSDVAYFGGPVDVPAVLALLQSPAKVEGGEHIFSSVYLISTKAALEQTLAAKPDAQTFHVYLGYAGWTKEQLQMEMELGQWFIFPADSDTVFNSDPGELWPQMIRKTELKYAGSKPAGPNRKPFAADLR